jgi:hypothetical protein
VDDRRFRSLLAQGAQVVPFRDILPAVAESVPMQERSGEQHCTVSHSTMDVDNHLSSAYMQVEGMLAGSIELEDFVQKG